MKKKRGAGDISAAEDMLPSLERDVYPMIDWGRLARHLVDAEQSQEPTERARYLDEAAAVAKGNPSAEALVKRTVDKLAKS